MGVFATRSPFRPHPIGLSCVRLEKIEQDSELGPLLYVSGADLMDNTPIYDIKPYLPYTDCRQEAAGGFAEPLKDYALSVDFPEELLSILPEELQEAALGVLACDPRPSYQKDPVRVYGVEFAGYDIRFTVKDDTLTVCELVPL